ncbi:MAG: retropepsin-like domain-containing protein [Bacteroidaceae bacterium]|nr:retropepsin-like domain-containing protein [Bacteroidaceae bacterium]
MMLHLVKQAYFEPEFVNAPAVVHLPVLGGMKERKMPIVQVVIGGYPYHFGFDTGSSACLFNSARLPEGQMDSVESIGQILTHDGVKEMRGCFVSAKDVELGELRIKEIAMPAYQAMDIPDDLDGLIGLGLVYDYDIYINWRDEEIMLIDPDSTDSVLAGKYELADTVPMSSATRAYCSPPKIRS